MEADLRSGTGVTLYQNGAWPGSLGKVGTVLVSSTVAVWLVNRVPGN